MAKYISVRQYDESDCGCACIVALAKYYKCDLSLSKIREVTKTDMNGTTLYGLRKGLEYIGMESKSVRVEKEGVFSKYTLPAIAHIEKENGLLHFVIIYKILKNDLIIMDPEFGVKKIKKSDFLKVFTGQLLLTIPGKEFKKIKNQNDVVKGILSLINKNKNIFIHIFLASVILTIFGLISSFFMKYLIDEILVNQLLNTLNIFVLGMAIFYTFQSVIDFCKNHLLIIIGQKLDIELLSSYYQHVLRLPMRFFSSRRVGEIITRFSDAMTIKDILSNTLLSVLIDIFMVVFVGVVLVNMNIRLFGIALAIIVINYLLILAFKKPYAIFNQEMMDKNAKLTSSLIESISGVESIKVSNALERRENLINEDFSRLLKVSYNMGITSNVQGLIGGLVNSLGELLILWIGANQIINGQISLGELIAFNTLSGMFLSPIQNLIGLQLSFQEVSISAKRLYEILFVETEESRDKDKIRIKKINNDIVMKNVNFDYGYRRNILTNINLRIKKGSKVAIVGETGSGKTTIAKLLIGFEKVEDGTIFINDMDIDTININSIRQRIAYVSQTPNLFTGTVLENLTVGTNASYEEIVELCKKLGCDEFIRKLPNGYNTLISENATNLSGGQKQRLSIVRALSKDFDLILFDEATSQLDTKTEKYLKNSIEELYPDKTVIYIAHRLSTVKSCDNIYLLDNGVICESGTHEELINKKGKYFELVNAQ